MVKKTKKNSKAEPANKTRLLLRLQKMNAVDKDSAKSLKGLGFTDKKKFERHLELLESEGKIKKVGDFGNYKYWAVRNKLSSKKKSKNTTFFVIWIVSTFVLLLLFVVVLSPNS